MSSVLSGPTIKVPSLGMPVLETARGRGFQASLPKIAPAPQIDARGFVAADMGSAAIGQGMQSFGSSLGRISEEMSEAVNTRRIAEARMATAAAQQDIAAEIAAEQDPTKWEGIAQARITEAQKNLISKGDSPSARQAIELHSREWGTHMAGQTKIAAISRQFDLTAQTLGVEHGQQIMAGDFAGAAATREKAAKYIGPGSLEGMRLKEIDAQREKIDTAADTLIKNGGSAAVSEVKELYLSQPDSVFPKEDRENRVAGMEYAAKVEDVKVLAATDPFRAAELARAHQLRGPDLLTVERIAEQEIRQRRATALDEYERSIKLGKLPSPEEIRDNPYLEDFDRVEVLNFAVQGPKNDPVSYATLFAEAANFKGDEGSPEYATLAKRAALALDGELQSSVLSKLGESVKNKNPDELTRSINEVYSLAKDDLAAGHFGPLHGRLSDATVVLPEKIRAEVDSIKKDLLTPEEKERIAKEPRRADYIETKARDLWWQRHHPKPADGESFENHVIEDAAAAAKAQRRYGDALMKLEKWKKEHPKAMPDELRAQYDTYLTVERAAGSVGTLLPDLNEKPQGINLSLEETRRIINFRQQP